MQSIYIFSIKCFNTLKSFFVHVSEIDRTTTAGSAHFTLVWQGAETKLHLVFLLKKTEDNDRNTPECKYIVIKNCGQPIYSIFRCPLVV